MNPNNAAKALEHFGWALVKYAQKVQKNNPGMAAKWYGEAHKRLAAFKQARKELFPKLWDTNVGRTFAVVHGNKFKAGIPPISMRKVDVFDHYEDSGDTRITYSVPAYVAVLSNVKAWRYSV